MINDTTKDIWLQILQDKCKVMTYKIHSGYDKCWGYVSGNRFFSLKHGCFGDPIKRVREFCALKYSFLISSGYNYFPLFRLIKKSVVIPVTDWKGLKDKSRNLIKKAQGELEIKKGIEYLDDFYPLYRLKGRLSKEVMKAILTYLPSELIIVKRDRVIGGTIVLFENIATYPYQVSNPEYLKYYPNQLMIWEAIKSANERGYKELDMGESTENSPTYQFKVNFGGIPRNIYYATCNWWWARGKRIV